MTRKDLKRLSRADLLEMLIDQSMEVQELRKRLAAAEAALRKREIAISKSGSIAEASLLLNGVFEAAQAACAEYVENTRRLYRQNPDLPYEPEETPTIVLPEDDVAEASPLPYQRRRRSARHQSTPGSGL